MFTKEQSAEVNMCTKVTIVYIETLNQPTAVLAAYNIWYGE